MLPLCHDRVILGKREEEAWLGRRDDSELCVRREYFIVYSGQFLEQHHKVIPSNMHIHSNYLAAGQERWAETGRDPEINMSAPLYEGSS